MTRTARRLVEEYDRDGNRQYTVALHSRAQLPTWLDAVRWERAAFAQAALYIKVAGLPEILR